MCRNGVPSQTRQWMWSTATGSDNCPHSLARCTMEPRISGTLTSLLSLFLLGSSVHEVFLACRLICIQSCVKVTVRVKRCDGMRVIMAHEKRVNFSSLIFFEASERHHHQEMIPRSKLLLIQRVDLPNRRVVRSQSVVQLLLHHLLLVPYWYVFPSAIWIHSSTHP